MNIKDFLDSERNRNKRARVLFTAIMQKAYGTSAIVIGHHLEFQINNDINTTNEIPSADTLLFDHDAMTTVFGNQAISIMQHLAATPTESRDQVLECYFNTPDPREEKYPLGGFEIQALGRGENENNN